MGNKIISIYKKRQNLILALLIFLFWIMLFSKSICITNAYPGVAVKDFSVMRPVSVPDTGDVSEVLELLKGEIGENFSFDSLYNTTYALFVFGLVALFMCFKNFGKGLLSKIVSLGYSVLALYSLLFTNNMAHLLRMHDTGYVLKLVVAGLIFVVSVIAIVSIVIELAKNSWLKYVNVHIFLNSICSILILAGLGLMFISFEYEGHTASIMGYLLMPNHYSLVLFDDITSFAMAFERSIPDFNINTVIMIPLLLFVVGILTSIFGAGYHKNIVVPVMSIAWAVLCILGCFLSGIMALDNKFVIYIVLSVGLIVVSVINLIQHHKANAIYR